MVFRITIDGTAGSGKSTTADVLASKLNYTRVNSGYIYRCITAYVLNIYSENYDLSSNEFFEKIQNLKISLKNNRYYVMDQDFTDKLRTPLIDKHVPNISKEPFIRKKVRQLQLDIINSSETGVVIDGRDTGTVVVPDAEIKFFMTASPIVRAKRMKKNENEDILPLDEIEKAIIKRDELDKNRKEGKLICPKDAIIIKNDNYTFQEQVDIMLEKIFEIMKQ
ncbi:Cytidylate kinase [Spraguea lophii 42_110]|uniref:(d)CMP kinase n=1 Tax=Spraguea lophii (strain 42_110) TaxID=1358809 RepID=S7XJD9_SPRLO|nr:Cytidylate kinase [Spraguea lophii 42_110]